CLPRMDNLTHSLTGLMMSRCGLYDGQKGTALMIVLAANAPDIDAFPFFTDSLKYLEQHRGYTHSLFFVPLIALIPILLVKGITRTRPTLWQYLACILAVFSHLAMDWTNVYGVRLLMPLTDRWFRLDITDVIDPLILAILAVSALVPAFVGLVSSE